MAGGHGAQLQPLRAFDGLVNGFPEIPVLLCRAFAAHVATVLVVVGLGYATTFEELFRPKFSTLARPDGLRNGEHHVADAQVLFRAYRDSASGELQVHEVREVAA